MEIDELAEHLVEMSPFLQFDVWLLVHGGTERGLFRDGTPSRQVWRMWRDSWDGGGDGPPTPVCEAVEEASGIAAGRFRPKKPTKRLSLDSVQVLRERIQALADGAPVPIRFDAEGKLIAQGEAG